MADIKITALTADTAPTSDDVIAVVDIGTTTTKKATLTNIITKAHGLGNELVKIAAGVMGTAAAGTDYIAPTAGTVKATYLQNAAADLGAANVDINLGNTNGAFVTNLTTDGLITATVGFSGPLTGNVTGDCSGTAATVTGATQANITSAANLATVGTITSGIWNAGAVTSSGAVQGTTLIATATASLTLGTGSSATGQEIYKNSTNNNTVTIQSGATSTSYTLTLPTAVAATTGFVLTSTDAGVLSWAAAGGGGSLDDAYNGGATITADAGAVIINCTTVGVDINSTGTTTNALEVGSDTLTTGGLGYFYSNSADINARNLVSIIHDNSAAINATSLYIKHDSGNGS